jgi:hypothetical protein
VSRSRLVFVDMNIDTSTSQGRLLFHIMAAFAEYESDVKVITRANHRLARSKGLPGGLSPLRLRRQPDQPHLRDLETRGRDGENSLPKLLRRRGLPISHREGAKRRREAMRRGQAVDPVQLSCISTTRPTSGVVSSTGSLSRATVRQFSASIPGRKLGPSERRNRRRIGLLRAAKGGPTSSRARGCRPGRRRR